MHHLINTDMAVDRQLSIDDIAHNLLRIQSRLEEHQDNPSARNANLSLWREEYRQLEKYDSTKLLEQYGAWMKNYLLRTAMRGTK